VARAPNSKTPRATQATAATMLLLIVFMVDLRL
jgi:hypothetical protein